MVLLLALDRKLVGNEEFCHWVSQFDSWAHVWKLSQLWTCVWATFPVGNLEYMYVCKRKTILLTNICLKYDFERTLRFDYFSLYFLKTFFVLLLECKSESNEMQREMAFNKPAHWFASTVHDFLRTCPVQTTKFLDFVQAFCRAHRWKNGLA